MAAIQAAHDKLHEYYAKTWAGMDAIAVILDPRLKMVYYKRSKWQRRYVSHAKGAIQHAIEVYGAAPPQPDVADDDSDRMDKWPFKKLKRCRINPESELDKYLKKDVIDDDGDALKWWKHHAGAYPCLARIASHETTLPSPRPVSHPSAHS